MRLRVRGQEQAAVTEAPPFLHNGGNTEQDEGIMSRSWAQCLACRLLDRFQGNRPGQEEAGCQHLASEAVRLRVPLVQMRDPGQCPGHPRLRFLGKGREMNS